MTQNDMHLADAALREPVEDEAEASAAPVSRAERREIQTKRIMDAARSCFVRSGFQGASMHDICREAEMSPGALYRYFPSKEAIIEAIAEEGRRQDAEILSVMLDNPDVVDGIVMAVMAHIRHTHDNGICALFTEVRAEALRNESVRASCEASMMQAAGAFRDYIQRGIDRGEIAPRVDLDTLMTVMMSIGEGLVLNDLPSRGIDLTEVEQMMRASVTANLRPTNRPDRQS